MWIYEKKLEYPVKIRHRNPKLAKIIIEQYGGPDAVYYTKMFLQSQRCIYTGLRPWINMTYGKICMQNDPTVSPLL